MTTEISQYDLIAKEVPRSNPFRLIAIDALVGKDLDELAIGAVMSDRGRDIEPHNMIDDRGIHLVRC